MATAQKSLLQLKKTYIIITENQTDLTERLEHNMFVQTGLLKIEMKKEVRMTPKLTRKTLRINLLNHQE